MPRAVAKSKPNSVIVESGCNIFAMSMRNSAKHLGGQPRSACVRELSVSRLLLASIQNVP